MSHKRTVLYAVVEKVEGSITTGHCIIHLKHQQPHMNVRRLHCSVMLPVFAGDRVRCHFRTLRCADDPCDDQCRERLRLQEEMTPDLLEILRGRNVVATYARTNALGT